jgi:hypothetical protein
VTRPGWRAAWGTLELRIGTPESNRSPWDLHRAGACAWWLSCCSAIRLPACSPGASLAFWATQVGPMWSTLGEKMGYHGGVWVFGPHWHTPRTQGGSSFGRGAVRCNEQLFLCAFLCCTHHNGSGPNHGPLGAAARARRVGRPRAVALLSTETLSRKPCPLSAPRSRPAPARPPRRSRPPRARRRARTTRTPGPAVAPARAAGRCRPTRAPHEPNRRSDENTHQFSYA